MPVGKRNLFLVIFFQIEIISGGNGQCMAEFTVRPENLNRGGGLHGGFTATVIDNFTTYALLTKDCPPGVTVDLHVRYLRNAFESFEKQHLRIIIEYLF